ncbi:MAG: head GIN domain-containing protein [Ferruginibacter sp.]
MKKILVIIAALIFVTNVNGQVQVVDDLNAEVRQLTDGFTSIIISGGIDVYLSQSNAEAIAVSASEPKLREAIKTEIKNGVLKIYVEGDKIWKWKSRNLRVYISFKNLQLLDVSGASDVVVAGSINSPDLSLKFSGASDFKGAVTVNTLAINLSGASDVKISGTAAIININSSGASDVSGFGLVTDDCKATASGASDINLTVNKEISAQASGASVITFRGSGELTKSNTSGASSIRRG